MKIDLRPGHCFDRRGPSAKANRDAMRSRLVKHNERRYRPR